MLSIFNFNISIVDDEKDGCPVKITTFKSPFLRSFQENILTLNVYNSGI